MPETSEVKVAEKKPDTVNGRTRWHKFVAFILGLIAVVLTAYLLKDAVAVAGIAIPAEVAMLITYTTGNIKEHGILATLMGAVTKGVPLGGKKDA